jgi:phosphosulfolactate synthase (CoM biosynthesis protein A)
MLPLVLPLVHKIQNSGLKEAPDKKHLLAFIQYIGPNNEWFELEIQTNQVGTLLTRLQQIRDETIELLMP